MIRYICFVTLNTCDKAINIVFYHVINFGAVRWCGECNDRRNISICDTSIVMHATNLARLVNNIQYFHGVLAPRRTCGLCE